MRNCLVCHHYGWTDIMNTLSITNYLLLYYNKIYLLCHAPKKPFYDFYYRNIKQIEIHTFNTPNDDLSLLVYFFQNRDSFHIIHLQLFGFYDKYREDNFQNIFRQYGSGNSLLDDTAIVNGRQNNQYYFVRKFYEAYEIPYINRVSSFFLDRDIDLEEKFYSQFIAISSYILIHDSPENTIPLERSSSEIYYQLNQSSNLFFDAIKVLQNAKEIHLIDSVWAAVCYLVDAKYNLLRHVPIFVYCLRGHQLMFKQPLQLPNWTIIDSIPRVIH